MRLNYNPQAADIAPLIADDTSKESYL